MNKTELKAQTQDVVIAKYDSYNNGSIGWDEYVSYLLDYMENFIKYRIREKHATLGAEFEDLMQQGRMAVIEQAKEFNPRIAQASTYFIRYIDQRLKEAVSSTKCMNKYYQSTAYKLEKVAKDYNYTGLDDPRLTLHDLQILSGISIKTIRETFDLMQMQLVSLEAVSENVDLPSLYRNPEVNYIKEERNAFLWKELSKLSPLEQLLIYNTIGTDNPISYKKMVKQLSTDEMRQKYFDELPKVIDQNFLETKVHNALSRIKHTKAFSMVTDATFKKPYDEPEEQVSQEYIEKALVCDMNFFED